MKFPGDWGNGTISVASTFLWALLIVAAAVGIIIIIGIAIGRFIAAGKSASEPIHVVTPCGINGHSYRVHHTGWRCATCGDGVHHEGELSDPVKDVPARAPRAA